MYISISNPATMNLKKLWSAALLALISFSSYGQIVTGTVNIAIPCCSSPPSTIYADSLDIDADNNYEFMIQSMYGIDNMYYYAQGRNNTQLNGLLVLVNASFPNSAWGSSPGMPSTPIGPGWTGWLPNTGFKYLGFRRINSPNDTTFGWAKLEFRGNASGPLDTVFILEYAYSTIPNVHLNAGQTTLSAVGQISLDNTFKVFPNPSTDHLAIENKSSGDFTITLTDITGRLLLTTQLKKEMSDHLDLAAFKAGLYFLTVDSGNNRQTYKIQKD
ncbi:MAG: hypothetical protein FD123_2656 [Bacteroidetes bacterium]|nr:MAG: hypothetical protein FD123_2656 [Bacteroidota bacterium]